MLRNRELAKLKEKIRKCQEYRWKIARAIELLKLQKASSKITQQEYDYKLGKILEGKQVAYWNDYYSSLISEYKSKISSIRRRQLYITLVPVLLIISFVILANLGQYTGQATYTGISQHGYVNRGGNCNYGTVGLITDTSSDDSIYFSQGPFNGAYTSFNWQSAGDIIYIDLGPISEARSDTINLSITWNGRFSKTTGTGKPPTDVGIAWYNWNTGQWTQFDQGIVSQSEKTSILVISDPLIIQDIISSETNGYVRLGFQALGTSTQCNSLILTDVTSSAVQATAKPPTSTTSSTTSTTSSTTIISSTTTSTSSTTIISSTSTSSTTTSTSTGTSTTTTTSPAQVIVTVASSLGIEVDAVYNTVDFSTLVVDTLDDTTDNIPLPILLRNEGSVLVDVQLSATDLWLSSSKLASDYRFSIDAPDPSVFTNTGTGLAADACSPLACFDASGTILTATDMPISPLLPLNAIDDLEFADANDEVEINIYIHVPNDEPAGSKSSTLTITGVDSSTF